MAMGAVSRCTHDTRCVVTWCARMTSNVCRVIQSRATRDASIPRDYEAAAKLSSRDTT